MRVLIIGDGVIGRSTAYYALSRGHEVTVVERAPEAHSGCSFGNAGMIVPSHFVPLAAPGMVALGLKYMWNSESPFYIKPRWDRELLGWGLRFWRASNRAQVERAGPVLRDLHLASRACYEALAMLPDLEFGLVKKGLLMLCQTERSFDEECRTAEVAKRYSVPAKILSPEQTAELDPGVRMDVIGSVHYPLDCHLAPERFMAGLKRHLERGGVTFHWQTEATGWRVEGGKVKALETTQGTLEAEEYVLCGGVWSHLLMSGLGLTLPMQAGKGYSVTLSKPPQLPSICAILTEARVAVTPIGRALRFGGTMEMAGLSETINSARVRGIVKSVPQYYPDFNVEEFEGLPVWHGLRPCSPDGLPYMGRCRRHGNLSVATGHAMMGLSLGPITGKIMAEILDGEPPSVEIDLLRPERFA